MIPLEEALSEAPGPCRVSWAFKKQRVKSRNSACNWGFGEDLLTSLQSCAKNKNRNRNTESAALLSQSIALVKPDLPSADHSMHCVSCIRGPQIWGTLLCGLQRRAETLKYTVPTCKLCFLGIKTFSTATHKVLDPGKEA